MQIVEILIILTICIVFIVYTQLYTIEFYLINASIIVNIIQSINGPNITNNSPKYFLKACL